MGRQCLVNGKQLILDFESIINNYHRTYSLIYHKIYLLILILDLEFNFNNLNILVDFLFISANLFTASWVYCIFLWYFDINKASVMILL